MGLDISVIRTPRDTNLEDVYAVKDAIEYGFYWYLGDDKEKRAEKWTELKDKCKSFTKDAILTNTSGPEDLVKYLKQIPDDKFDACLKYVIGSISDHKDGNTHLNFDDEKLPGKTIFFSRSENLLELFKRCELKTGERPLRPCGDFIREIDPCEVYAIWERWKSMSWKLKLAKWIGYFSERTGNNIRIDCLRTLGVWDEYVDDLDVEHYLASLKKVVDETIETDERLWLTESR